MTIDIPLSNIARMIRAAARRCCRRVMIIGCLSLVLALPAAASGADITIGDDLKVDVRSRSAVIDSISALLLAQYVFPETARQIADHLAERNRTGAYDDIDKLNDFLQTLMRDLWSVKADRHMGFRVMSDSPGAAAAAGLDDRWRDQYNSRMRYINYGFNKVERLPGNIGLLDMSEFTWAHLGGATAHAAMTFLSHCDAVIIDLRKNWGGRREVIEIILSYFFDEPVHYITETNRIKNHTVEHWTHEHVPGKRLADVPVYVLTGHETYSGGEMMAFALQNLGRATLIGDTTGGAAHGTHLSHVPNLRLEVYIPHEIHVDPATGKDWEGVGVIPDVAVPSGQALAAAHAHALKEALQKEDDEVQRYEREWFLRPLEAAVHPVELADEELQTYVGRFGKRRISIENGALVYQREGSKTYRLVPMGNDWFKPASDELYYFQIQFERAESGDITRLIGWYDNGKSDSSDRTDD